MNVLSSHRMSWGPNTDVTRSSRWFQPEVEGSRARLIVDAADICLERWGWAKTTLDDVAKEAGCSRATLYRTFPGGKEAILEAHRRHRVATFFNELEPALSTGETLEEALVAVIVASSERLRGDGEFQRRLSEDPGSVLPQISLDGMSRVFALGRVFIVPHIERFLPKDEANVAVEWVTRLVISYAACDGPTIELSDSKVASDFVRRRILPGISQELNRPSTAIRTG